MITLGKEKKKVENQEDIASQLVNLSLIFNNKLIESEGKTNE